MAISMNGMLCGLLNNSMSVKMVRSDGIFKLVYIDDHCVRTALGDCGLCPTWIWI